MKYTFKSRIQEEAEANERRSLLEEKKLTEGKKLLKEATFSVTTVDDAMLAIQECMKLIALKKRSPVIFTDMIASSVIAGLDQIAQELGTGEASLFSDKLKKRVILTVRNSLGM